MQDQPELSRLSAALDGELAPDEAAALAATLAGDQAARQRWERYHLARDVMHGLRRAGMPRDFADRVAAAISAQQPAPMAHRRRIGGRGWALAAGIAGVALVLGWLVVGELRVEAPATLARMAPARPVAASQPRMDRYLVGHNEFGGSRAVPSVLPYARLVSHQSAPDDRRR